MHDESRTGYNLREFLLQEPGSGELMLCHGREERIRMFRLGAAASIRHRSLVGHGSSSSNSPALDRRKYTERRSLRDHELCGVDKQELWDVGAWVGE